MLSPFTPAFRTELMYSTLHTSLHAFLIAGIEVLNDVRWTSALDEFWRDNYEADDSLLWQYFGTHNGVMRIFPGSQL